MQNARENPLAAAAVAAAVAGQKPPPQSNIENLLDIDFDGAAPASAQKSPPAGMSGLEGLAGTPQRVASPSVPNGSQPSNSLDDLMGLGDVSTTSNSGSGGRAQNTSQDLLDGFAGLGMATASQPPPPPAQQLSASGGNDGGSKKANDEDLLGLF